MAYHNLDGHRLYYERHGEGKPLIVLNGIMMQTESWYALLPMMAKRRQVILVDFPDQGRSDTYPGESYNLEDVSRRMLLWIQALEVEHYDLLGISYGGEVALHLLPMLQGHEMAPDRLILANTTLRTGERLKAIGAAWTAIALTYDAGVFFDVCMPDIYSEAFYDAHFSWIEERKQALKTLLTPEWFDRFVRLVKSADDHDARQVLEKIHVPTLLIGADSDTLTPLPHQEAIAAGLKDAKLVVLAGAGHASMYEVQGAFCECVESFLSEV